MTTNPGDRGRILVTEETITACEGATLRRIVTVTFCPSLGCFKVAPELLGVNPSAARLFIQPDQIARAFGAAHLKILESLLGKRGHDGVARCIRVDAIDRQRGLVFCAITAI